MCLFPVRAQPQEFGKPKLDPEGELQLPCGKCFECKSKRAFDWAIRCKHEIACHNENSFITLTYDDENLPSFLIVKDYFQKFIKRLRKLTKQKLKYIVSHEYGSKSGRPHHHCIIFGWNPSNQVYLQKAPSGEPLFTSEQLEKLWPYGYHSIGTANEKTAYYIASYSLKSSKHSIICPNTGSITEVSDSMDSSRRTAIGYEYFMQHYQQLSQLDELLPRYYVKLLDRHYPDYLEIYQNNLNIKQNNPKGSFERLAKFVITNQKDENANNNFRSQPNVKKERDGLRKILEMNRDEYQHCMEVQNVNSKNLFS